MIYGKRVSRELSAQIAEETQFFHLPPDWREGREPVHGFTIDEKHTRTREDAVFAQCHKDGDFTLSVSIADAASFLIAPSAMRKLARIRGETAIDMHQIKYPVWPDEVTSYLGFVQHEERPAVTTHIPVTSEGELGEPRIVKGTLRADVCNREWFGAKASDVDSAMPDGRSYAALYAVTQRVEAHRQHQPTEPQYRLPSHTEIASHIVSEAMQANGRAMGRFLLEHSIPALYRFSGKYSHSRALFAVKPENEADPYVRLSSPLTRFTDFVCQANVVAFLDGEDFPYTVDRLQAIAEQYNNRAQKKHVPSGFKAQRLYEALQDKTASLKDIAAALVTPSNLSNSDTIRRAAFEHAIADPDQLRQLINILQQQGALTLRAARPEDAVPTVQVLEDATGNISPYWPRVSARKGDPKYIRERIRQQRADALTLAQSALKEVPEFPWYLFEEADSILEAPHQLKEAGHAVQYRPSKTTQGLACVRAVIRYGGQEFRAEATELTDRLARARVAHALSEKIHALQEASLAALPAEQQALSLLRSLDSQHKHGARHYLAHLLQSEGHAKHAELQYVTNQRQKDGQLITECHLSFEYKNQQHTITVEHVGGHKATKEIAALRALRLLNAPILDRLPKKFA